MNNSLFEDVRINRLTVLQCRKEDIDNHTIDELNEFSHDSSRD